MVTRVTLDRRGSSIGRTGRFCIAQTALALPGRALFRRSNPFDAGAAKPRRPAMQQRALRYSFYVVPSNSRYADRGQ
jgi:hypothetical protein